MRADWERTLTFQEDLSIETIVLAVVIGGSISIVVAVVVRLLVDTAAIVLMKILILF